MPLSTMPPERLESLRRETPPLFDEWADRVGWNPQYFKFLQAFADKHAAGLMTDLLFDALTPMDRERVRCKYRDLRQAEFENFWMDLPEGDK